jgi:hypothetical protein
VELGQPVGVGPSDDVLALGMSSPASTIVVDTSTSLAVEELPHDPFQLVLFIWPCATTLARTAR